MKLIDLYEDLQHRVIHGDTAQMQVNAFLENHFGDRYQFISMAGKHKKQEDILAELDGEQIRIEVKNRKSVATPIKLYEKMIGRDQPDRTLDAVAKILGFKNFTNMVEKLRTKNPRYGFPGDEGTSKSGSIWVKIQDRPSLSKIRRYIINSLQESGDNYLAIYNSGDKTVSLFYTGLGPNPAQAPRIPNIHQIVLDTYGGSYKNKMRAGLKIFFMR